MAMFDDPKKELQRLEKQLLKEEEWFDEELEFAKALIGDEPAPQPRKKTTQRPMEQTQVYRAVESEPQVRNYANGYGKNQPEQVRNYANNYGQSTPRNIYDYDMDQEDYEDAPAPKGKKKKEKGIKGLVVLACLETLGIVGVVAYWLLFLL